MSQGRQVQRIPLFAVVFGALAFAGCFRLYREALANSNDFAVYYRAIADWLAGVSPYLIRPELEGFVFKYPPWAVPPMFWLGFVSFPVAVCIWLTICFAMLALTARWLIARGVSWRVALLTTGLFWWIWLAHASAGQFTMILMGAGVIGFEVARTREYGVARASTLALVFGAKVFSLATLLGDWRRLLRPRPVLGTLAIALVLHIVYFAVAWAAGNPATPLEHYREWAASAASGSAELGWEIVRGQGNHGFAAAILRLVDPHAERLGLDFGVYAMLTIGLGALWTRASRSLAPAEAWAGWMALGVVVLPLAWHHSFVVAYPLCAFALDRAWRTRSHALVLAALLGIACIGIFIPQVIGKTLVKPLELAGMKSWGVVISATTLWWAKKGASV